MPEVREVFDMSTQKVKPDPGFVDRQDDHQRDHERKRKIGAFAVVAAIVLTPAGATATAKRAQALAAGAQLLEVRGTFDDALQLCRELGQRPGYVLVNSINPDRVEGQKSVVFEILEQHVGVGGEAGRRALRQLDGRELDPDRLGQHLGGRA